MYLLLDKSSHDIFSFWLRPAAKSIEYQAKRKIVIEWGGEWLDQLISIATSGRIRLRQKFLLSIFLSYSVESS